MRAGGMRRGDGDAGEGGDGGRVGENVEGGGQQRKWEELRDVDSEGDREALGDTGGGMGRDIGKRTYTHRTHTPNPYPGQGSSD